MSQHSINEKAKRLAFVCEITTDERLAQCIARHDGETPLDLAASIFREFIYPVSKATQELLDELAVSTK